MSLQEVHNVVQVIMHAVTFLTFSGITIHVWVIRHEIRGGIHRKEWLFILFALGLTAWLLVSSVVSALR